MAQSADSNFTGSGGNACLGVTWRLHFWQNGLGLLRAIAVAQGGTLNESAHKVNSGEENSPAALSRIQTRNLLITSPAPYQLSYPGSPVPDER